MSDAHKNFPYSFVDTPPLVPASGTSLAIGAGTGSLFPAVPFNATVWPAGTQPTAANAEIVRVTANASDVWTVVRQQEGTSARTIAIGDQVAATVTAQTLDECEGSMSPASSRQIRAKYCEILCRPLTVNSGVVLTINAGGKLMVIG